MTGGAGVVDLEAVRQVRRRLNALALAHPELAGESDPNNAKGWERILADDEERMVTKQVGFRLPDELRERIEDYMERMRAAAPGMDINMADAVRVLLTKALDAEEADSKRTSKRGK